MIIENHASLCNHYSRSPVFFPFSFASLLHTQTTHAMASFARVSTPARRMTSRGGPVRVVAKGDGARVDRSSKSDVM